MNKTFESKLKHKLLTFQSMKKSCKGKKSSYFIIDLMSFVQSALAQNLTFFFNLVGLLSQTVTDELE